MACRADRDVTAAHASYETAAAIRRPPEEVFAYLSDLRSELDWNPNARRVDKLTPGPLGRGTRFRAEWRGAPSTLVEITAFDWPRLWQTASRSWGMQVTFTGEVTPDVGGARYVAHLDLTADGLGRLLLPFAVRAMRRQDALNIRRIVDALEGRDESSRASEPAIGPKV